MKKHLTVITNRVAAHAQTGWQWVDAKLHPFPENLGPAFKKHFESISNSQFFDAKKLQALQNEQLKKLITHAYNHVPYYSQVMKERGLKPKDIQSRKDLVKLPLLTKQMIRDHYNDLIADNAQPNDWIESHTSGSTGQPLHFLLTSDSNVRENAYTFRAWSFGGYELGDPVILLRSYVPKPGQPLHYHDQRNNYHYLSAYHLNPKVMRSYVRIINRTRAKIIRGYPSSLYIFCRFLLEQNIRLQNISIAITSSEILLPHYRKTISDAIGGNPVLDWYGCNERVVTLSQCPESGSAYHTNPEYGLLEVVNDKGEVITEGMGYVVGTQLQNFVMPLIRYMPNDLVTIQKPEKCSCGRGLPLEVLSIQGRSDEILTYGSKMTPAANFYTLFQTIPGVVQFQLIQKDSKSLQVLLIKNSEYTEQSEQKTIDGLQDRIGKSVKIELTFVTEIARDPKTGKVKCVVNHTFKK